MSSLTEGTLVLNRSWIAVQICSVRRAVSLLFQGHAKAVDAEYNSYTFDDWHQVSQQMIEVPEDEFISSPSIKIRIPRVIVLVFYDRLPKRDVAFSRKNIFERDDYSCQYCGAKPPRGRKEALKWMEKTSLNLDHVVPRSRGGKTTWENLVACCFKCNSKKRNHTLEELGWKLKKTPGKPNWHPVLKIPLKSVRHKEWVSFLDVAYWNVELENDEGD